MKNNLIKSLILLFIFFANQAYSNTVNAIKFIGLNNTTENTLIKYVPFKIGDEYSDSASNATIQSLFKTGLFSDISIINNDGVINISVLENPTIKYFEFNLDSESGFSNWLKNEKKLLTPEQLNEIVITNNLSSGNPFTQQKLDELILTLNSKYFGSGYYNVAMSQETSIDTQNRVGIDITIQQGERAKIEKFTISGANSFSEDTLLKFFKIGEPDMSIINYFTKKDFFSDTEFDNGIEMMTYHYFNKGFLDFKVLDIVTNLDNDKEKISLDIQISEGIQYKLGKVSFDGEFGQISPRALDDAISLKEGDEFNREAMIQDIQTITDLFADEGYAFVDVNPVLSELLDTVNINFIISLNKKVYINRIVISGNTRTQDDVIRREIGVSEGGLYSRSLLRSSLLKLRRLGYFSDVQISTSEVAAMPDKIDVIYSVEETQTGAVSFSVSHSNNYGVSLGAGIQEKNIFGSGNTLNADFKVSESYNRVSFYFMNPNYNDQGHSVSIGAFKSEINDDDVAENSYEIDTLGFSFGYGIPLSNDTRINTELEYSENEIKCSSLFSGTGYESSQCANKNNDELKLNIKWNQNTLNDYQYPTEGINNTLAAGIALPPGDYRYFNINADHSSYRPVSDTTTLKLTGSFNLSKGYSDKALPFYKRNFGGGSGSVRGFANKSLGPLYPNGKAKGGEISILGSANLIAPAFFIEDNEKMRLSAFIDAGNIYEKSSNIELGDIRMSAGFGFAYLSPIGSIGAFISTPILKKDGDIIEDFGFSLGTGF